MAFKLPTPTMPDSGAAPTKPKKVLKGPEWDAAYRPGIRPLPLISISKNTKPVGALSSMLRMHYGKVR